jgi:D-glycero-D-manno-heptose 1,7-bisphosphate phosphatase
VKSNRAVFLDRDGTIIEETHHLSRASELKLINGAAEGIKLLKNSGFKIILITNQSAVARGYLTEPELFEIHQVLAGQLRSKGVDLDAIYYCPHHPTEGGSSYQMVCNCRKPEPGMLLQAKIDLGVNLRKSFVVGDKMSDLEAGFAVGCRGVLVRTGYGLEVEARLDGFEHRPNYIADNLLEASLWIGQQEVEEIIDGGLA